MLPNRFPDEGQAPEYNTVDATLWYFEAVRAYHEATLRCAQGRPADDALLRDLFPALQDIVDWHVRGTRYQIHVDPADGLLYAGEPGVQLTWMDAEVEDWVVTPRTGKPVEVNALWCNALCVMAEFARLLERRGRHLLRRAGRSRSTLPAEQQKAVVRACARHLLTSHGLRSLDPRHPDYKGHHGGDRRTRDAAYHQGTVWGWLIGPFVSAHLRVYRDAALARSFLWPLIQELDAHGVGSLSEIFDGDPPHAPRGCIAQAWTVAEVLRVWKQLASTDA